ncbi:uridine kinase [Cutibacterium sp.]|uniref:uridine kinase n=1 Tax=Cutibacterium sp. TaxID=1912221 RepID=UPI0026DDADAE|nr:uridine kinase [Cutibacterium sp.]MDO4413227.1 uridine kinase [Cutibacterium sp.]
MAELPELRLDDFYRNGDEPDLPRIHGMVDWDDVISWNLPAAVDALKELATIGHTVVPCYDISKSRAEGTHVVNVAEAPAVIAEGIFALDLLDPCLRVGMDVLPIWLDRPRWFNFARRLIRDLRQHRKSPPVLIRRGLALCQAEPALRSRAIVMGFQPMSMRRASAIVAAPISDVDHNAVTFHGRRIPGTP